MAAVMAGLALGFALAAALTFRAEDAIGPWLALGLAAAATGTALVARHRVSDSRPWAPGGDEQASPHDPLLLNEESVWARLLEADAVAARRSGRSEAAAGGSRVMH